MRVDEEIQQLLEEHFEETARPMPLHVLEASLEGVSRRGQMPGAGTRLGWVQRGVAVSVVAIAVLVVVVSLPALLPQLRTLLGGGPATDEDVMRWNAMMEFVGRNPAGDGYGNRFVWTYLHSEGPQRDRDTYLPMPAFEETDDMVRWWDPAYQDPQLYIGVPAGHDQLEISPWGGGEEFRAAIIAWRAPVTASLVVNGEIEVDGACGDGIVFTIQGGTDVLHTQELSAGMEPFRLVLERWNIGDTMYFVFEPGANSLCDTTRFSVRIETN